MSGAAEGPEAGDQARLERYQVETAAISSGIRIKERRADAEVESMETDREDTRLERRVFVGVVAFGTLLTAVMAIIASVQAEPLFYSGTGAGLIVSGGGLLRLRVLTSGKGRGRKARKPKPARPC